jgi:hypothetical protein
MSRTSRKFPREALAPAFETSPLVRMVVIPIAPSTYIGAKALPFPAAIELIATSSTEDRLFALPWVSSHV